MVAAILCFIVGPLIERMYVKKIGIKFSILKIKFQNIHRKIDDAVGATAVHLVGGIWGEISVGLFADPIDGHQGLFYGNFVNGL